MPIITTYYKNLFTKKRLVKERYIVDENGVKNGLYQSYHKNGQVSETSAFKNGIKHGFCVIKHENGRVATECSYQEGCLEGDYISYYADGHKRLECTFRRDRINGTYRLFRPDGELEVLYTYLNGVKHGPCEIRQFGEEVEKIQYQNDKVVRHELIQRQLTSKLVQTLEHGELKEFVQSIYTPDGFLKERIVSDSEFRTTSHEIYNPQTNDSRPYIRFTCTNGRKEGEYTRFGMSTFPIEVSHYQRGKLHGSRRLYFDGLSSPVLREESNYRAGELDGLYIRYHEDGKIAERCRYRRGKKIIYPQHIQSVFEKQADSVKRVKISEELKSLRRLGKRKEAMVVAQKFHLENSDIPRRTALKMDKQKSRA